LILLAFSKSSVSPLAPKNQHFRQEVLVFAYLNAQDGQTQAVPARLYGF
jgi:hypothetical protein